MINRECQRLELSIKDAINNYDNTKEIIAFMHYPPLVKQQLLENNHLEFYKVLKKYDIKDAIMDICMEIHIKMLLTEI